MKKIDFEAMLGIKKEELGRKEKEHFQESKKNPENMSYWFPKITNSQTIFFSNLRMPKTKIVDLDFEDWKWLRSDSYSDEKIKAFTNFLLEELGTFLDDKKLFIKSGIFSNKFNFSDTLIESRESLGHNFLNIYYASMMLGADFTSEVVFRELIENNEERKTIYNGMPLRTEFRVFYNFDKKEVIGAANYWHPEVMESPFLEKEDKEMYKKEKRKILNEFNSFKKYVSLEVHALMKGVDDLKGNWSIDVMKNGKDFWLIDMARMEKSALVDKIEKIE